MEDVLMRGNTLKTCLWPSMDTAATLLLCFLALQGTACAGIDTAINEANRVILSSRVWNPSVEQTRNAITAIQLFLEKPNATNDWSQAQIKEISHHTKEYRVQFRGVIHDGRKLVHCNFFPTSIKFPYWKQEEVSVSDGGYWFWQIDYDPKTHECVNLVVNGDG